MKRLSDNDRYLFWLRMRQLYESGWTDNHRITLIRKELLEFKAAGVISRKWRVRDYSKMIFALIDQDYPRFYSGS